MAPIEEIFCELDDFCKAFFPQFERHLLPTEGSKRRRALSMSASEIMTIVILFHLIPTAVVNDPFDRVVLFAGQARVAPWCQPPQAARNAASEQDNAAFGGAKSVHGCVGPLARCTASRYATRLSVNRFGRHQMGH